MKIQVVKEVCEIAAKEFQIENALDNIEKKWETLELVIEPYKKKSFRILKTEEVFQILEDNMSNLSSQKTTLFYESFKSRIEKWENLLLNVQETLDMLL